MQKHLISAVGILALALLGGCDKPKPPQAVANDVSTDQQKAAKEVAKAQTDASKDISTAAAKVDEKKRDPIMYRPRPLTTSRSPRLMAITRSP